MYGCSSGANQISEEQTEFGRMLGYIPAEYLDENDVWFGDLTAFWAIYDPATWPNAEEFLEIPEDERWQMICISQPLQIASMLHWYPIQEMKELAGFDHTGIERLMLVEQPRGEAAVLEGNFDADIISKKLTGLGYTEEIYEATSYYSHGNDYELDMQHPISARAMASLNRIYISQGVLILAPATDLLTRILDAMDGIVPSAIDTASIRALADSLGEVSFGLLTTPERVVGDVPTDISSLSRFSVPDTWSDLPDCEMAAFGWHNKGEDWYLDIALAYTDKPTATEAGKEIVRRMQDYELMTWGLAPSLETPFKDNFRPGEPAVTGYKEGAAVKISCSMVPGSSIWPLRHLLRGYPRDLLFLAPEPAKYIIE